MPGTLLKLLVKDKLLHSREVHVNAKEWQLKPLRREKRGHSRKVPMNAKEWQLKPPEERERRLRRMKAIHTGPNASKVLSDDAAGLEPVICIAHGAWIMLTSNF